MKRNIRFNLTVIGVISVFIIAYGVTYGLMLLFPPSEQNAVYHGMFTLFLIVVLLAAPYFALKLMGHAAHIRNPEEKELHLKDLPKDKERLHTSK